MTPAERAALLQDEGFLNELKARIQRKLYNKWAGTHPEDEKQREALYLTAQAAHGAVQEIAALANEWKASNGN